MGFGWSFLEALKLQYLVHSEDSTTVASFLQLQSRRFQFQSDKAVAKSELTKSLGQLLYLKNLTKVGLVLNVIYIGAEIIEPPPPPSLSLSLSHRPKRLGSSSALSPALSALGHWAKRWVT